MKRNLTVFLAGAVTVAMILSGCSTKAGTDPKANSDVSGISIRREQRSGEYCWTGFRYTSKYVVIC